MKKTKTKDLNYYKNNCEEDYIKTPISVLRYISELEQAINYTHSCKSDSEQLLAYTEFLRKELHLNISDTWIESYKKNSK